MSELSDKKWITVNEVILKTGISLPTLKEYIKIGILPKPIIRKKINKQKEQKEIYYFPESVIWRIKLVKRLKQKGEPIEKISQQFGDISMIEEMFPEPNETHAAVQKTVVEPVNEESQIKKDDQQQEQPQNDMAIKSNNADQSPTKDKRISLTPEEMSLPAYLLNHNFEVEWINSEAEHLIFNSPIGSISDVKSRNIFKLLFGFETHLSLENWQDVISFHISFLRRHHDVGKINELYQGISESEIAFLKDIYEESEFQIKTPASIAPIQLDLKDGMTEYFKVHSTVFKEGIFFVYVPTNKKSNDIMGYLEKSEDIFNDFPLDHADKPISLCVLSAELQDSEKIGAELLPNEYFKFLSELWGIMGQSVDKFDGIKGTHSGNGVLCYFLEKSGTDPIKNAIRCALDLREKTEKFNRDWRIKRDLQGDLYLNIGITDGKDFFGAIHSFPTFEFRVLGDSVKQAETLSQFGRYGEIWTTKSVVGKMDYGEIGKIRFGVNRKIRGRDQFIPETFLRIMDVMEKEDKEYEKFVWIESLSITQITSHDS